MTERTLFLEALEIADPAEREAYLDRACAGDADLRRQVQALLAAHERPGSFLERPAVNPAGTGAYTPGAEGPAAGDSPETQEARAAACEAPGALIGPYKLLELIGEGGMGAVWMAEQRAPVRRRVALKVIKAGMDTRQVVARFEAERQALALMDHPHIARVFDGGAADSGRPYFVMELVKGVPLTRYCDDHKLTPRERLELFVPVCHAVQHAHQKGIIHRDLKPSNILVAPYDGRPVPKVIDFGVAKAAGGLLTEKTLFTGFGAVVGTPEYMSPEQAELNNQDIDTRSDVYSLGVLLYELLTGTTPLTRQRVKDGALLEVLRLIREEEPPRLSTRLSTTAELPAIAANRGLEPKKLSGVVRGELDWIVMKALEKDRNRRYESANALAADLQRYLTDEPVLACPPSASYRLRKAVRRHKGAVLTAALAVLLLVTAVVGQAVTNHLIREEQKLKEEALEQARDNYQESEENLALARQAVDEMYTRVAEDLKARPHMQPLERELFQKALRFYQEFARRKARDPHLRLETALAYQRVAGIQWSFARHREAEEAQHRAFELLKALAGELPADPRRRAALAEGHAALGFHAADGGRSHDAEKHYRQAIELYAALAAEQPDVPAHGRNLAATHYRLGAALAARPALAEQEHREAVRLCEAYAARWPGDRNIQVTLAESFFQLGVLFSNTGQRDRAEDAYRQAIAFYEKVGGQLDRITYRTNLAQYQAGLAGVLAATGRGGEAEKAWRAAVELMEQQVMLFPDNPSWRIALGNNQIGLAAALARAGKAEEAAALRRTAGQLFRQLWDERADEWSARFLGSVAWGLREVGDFPAAEKAIRQRLGLVEAQLADAPREPALRKELMHARANLGTLLQRDGRLEEAAGEFRRALATCDALASEFPEEPDYQYQRARYWNFLGIVLRGLPDRREEAMRLHAQAIRTCTGLVAGFPEHHPYRGELVRSHYSHGLALRLAGCWKEAEQAYGAALAQWRESPGQPYDGNPAAVHNELAWLLATCPDAGVRDAPRAVALARRAVELDPQGGSWNTLGIAHYRAGNCKEAVAALETAMKLRNGGDSHDWFFLAMAHAGLGEHAAANRLYEQAVAWMKKHSPRDPELLRFQEEARQTINRP
jgi:serine/threonine protein kinase